MLPYIQERTRSFIRVLLMACLAAPFGAAPALAAPPLKVLTDFPGGAARVEAIDQDSRSIRLVPPPTPERGWVCWWHFKVEGIEPGETITVHVQGSGFAIPDRAMFSLDNRTWKHVASSERVRDGGVYKQTIDGKEAWFAWGPPFVLSHANQLVEEAVKACPDARAFELCKSKDGHAVPGLRIEPGKAGERGLPGIWIQARQHAWESGSSWVAAGFVHWLLSDDAQAKQLRQKCSITVIPIMDVDNVERGAGGKNQKPHDHNRDWSDQPVWPEVQAAIKQITALDAAGRLDLFIDLHNPGPGDRQPFFFIPGRDLVSAVRRRNQDSFLDAARAEIKGPLKLAAQARESGPNYDKNWERISGNWVARNSKEHVVAVCLETAWNTPQSTVANYQQVGRELGLAIERYLRESGSK
jgi:hypothetical protein